MYRCATARCTKQWRRRRGEGRPRAWAVAGGSWELFSAARRDKRAVGQVGIQIDVAQLDADCAGAAVSFVAKGVGNALDHAVIVEAEGEVVVNGVLAREKRPMVYVAADVCAVDDRLINGEAHSGM